ncbi:hypothetical protein JCM3770_006405 [Rhodotorula araucariae]
MSLPAVPPGQNPWAVYLDTLEGLLYPKLRNAQGFSARAYILMGVCAYGICISLVYGGVVARRVRRQGKTYWVARKVDGYLVLNLAFFAPAGGAIGCAFMLTYTALQHRLFTLAIHPDPSIYTTIVFRTFCWIPLVLHGFCLTAAAAQAGLVVCSRTAFPPTQRARRSRFPGHMPSPRVVNSLFWIGLAVLLLALLLPDILFTVSWTRLYSQIAGFERFLVVQRAMWISAEATPISGEQLLDLLLHFNAVTAADDRNSGYHRAVVYALIVAPCLLALVTAVAGVFLHVLLRRQIRARKARRAVGIASPFALPELAEIPSSPPSCGSADIDLEGLHTHGHALTRGPPPEFVVSLAGAPLSSTLSGASAASPAPVTTKADHQRPPHPRYHSLTGLATFSSALGLPKVKGIRPTSAESHRPFAGLVAGVEGKAESPVGTTGCAEWEGARVEDGNDEALAELRCAQRDLGVCTGAVFALTLAFTAENLWNVIAVVPLPYTELSWAVIEASFFLPPWLYATVYAAGPTGLLVFSLLSRTPSSPPSLVARHTSSRLRVPLPAFLRNARHRACLRRSDTDTRVGIQRPRMTVVISQRVEHEVEVLL